MTLLLILQVSNFAYFISIRLSPPRVERSEDGPTAISGFSFLSSCKCKHSVTSSCSVCIHQNFSSAGHWLNKGATGYLSEGHKYKIHLRQLTAYEQLLL